MTASVPVSAKSTTAELLAQHALALVAGLAGGSALTLWLLRRPLWVFLLGFLVGVAATLVGEFELMFKRALRTSHGDEIPSPTARDATASQHVFHESRVDPESLSALLGALGLEEAKKLNDDEAVIEEPEPAPPLVSRLAAATAGPSRGVDGWSIAASALAADESDQKLEKALVDAKTHAKERTRSIKLMHQWLLDYGASMRSHAKAMTKLAGAATATIQLKTPEDSERVSEAGDGPSAALSAADDTVAGCARETDGAVAADTAQVGPAVVENRPLHLWWQSMASTLHLSAHELNRVADTVVEDVAVVMHKLQAEQAHLDQDLSNEGVLAVKELKDATLARTAADKVHARATVKLDAFVQRVGGNASADAVTALPEHGRLQRQLEDAQGKLVEATRHFDRTRDRFRQTMPQLMDQYMLLDRSFHLTLHATLQRVVKEAMQAMDGSRQAQQRLWSDLQSTQHVLGSLRRGLGLSDGAKVQDALEAIEWVRDRRDAPAAGSTTAGRQHGLRQLLSVEEDETPPPAAAFSSDAKDVSGQAPGSSQLLALDMWSDSAAALAAALPSILPTIPPTAAQRVGDESCVWVNAFMGRVYRDAARSAYFHEWLRRQLQHALNRGKSLPGYVDELTIENLRLGPTPPLLTAVRWVPTSAIQGAELEYDIGVDAKMAYRGGLSFTVATKLWLNWPRDRYAFLQVSVDIRLVELSGAVRLGVRKHRSFVSFLAEPFANFEVVSHVGGNHSRLPGGDKLDALVIDRIKSQIRRKLVWPQVKTFRLLWPKTWWPPDDPGSPNRRHSSRKSGAAAAAANTEEGSSEQTALKTAAGEEEAAAAAAAATAAGAGAEQQHGEVTQPPDADTAAVAAAASGGVAQAEESTKHKPSRPASPGLPTSGGGATNSTDGGGAIAGATSTLTRFWQRFQAREEQQAEASLARSMPPPTAAPPQAPPVPPPAPPAHPPPPHDDHELPSPEGKDEDERKSTVSDLEDFVDEYDGEPPSAAETSEDEGSQADDHEQEDLDRNLAAELSHEAVHALESDEEEHDVGIPGFLRRSELAACSTPDERWAAMVKIVRHDVAASTPYSHHSLAEEEPARRSRWRPNRAKAKQVAKALAKAGRKDEHDEVHASAAGAPAGTAKRPRLDTRRRSYQEMSSCSQRQHDTCLHVRRHSVADFRTISLLRIAFPPQHEPVDHLPLRPLSPGLVSAVTSLSASTNDSTPPQAAAAAAAAAPPPPPPARGVDGLAGGSGGGSPEPQSTIHRPNPKRLIPSGSGGGGSGGSGSGSGSGPAPGRSGSRSPPRSRKSTWSTHVGALLQASWDKAKGQPAAKPPPQLPAYVERREVVLEGSLSVSVRLNGSVCRQVQRKQRAPPRLRLLSCRVQLSRSSKDSTPCLVLASSSSVPKSATPPPPSAASSSAPVSAASTANGAPEAATGEGEAAGGEQAVDLSEATCAAVHGQDLPLFVVQTKNGQWGYCCAAEGETDVWAWIQAIRRAVGGTAGENEELGQLQEEPQQPPSGGGAVPQEGNGQPTATTSADNDQAAHSPLGQRDATRASPAAGGQSAVRT